MASGISKSLTAALLLCLCGLASAALPAIDIFTAPGVPDTGGATTVQGPCYCDQEALFSPVLLLQPGTYDLGEVREYWVQSGYTPDGGDDQPNLYLLFDPVALTGAWPYDFPAEPDYAYPSLELCAQDDAACNASYVGASQDFDLVVTVPPDENAVQIGLIGNYVYTPPVPEPSMSAMLIAGFMLLAARKKQGRA